MVTDDDLMATDGPRMVTDGHGWSRIAIEAHVCPLSTTGRR